ncbi:MAG: sterol desaturase family protein [Saonia sp.]
MEQIDLWEPLNLFIFAVILFLIIFIRYLIVAGAYHYIFYVLFRKRFKNRIIDLSPVKQQQQLKEIYWSAMSALVFTLFGAGMFFLWLHDYTAIYVALNTYPIWYLFVSVFLALFIQDTYYYWLHRWMHLPRIYKYLHRVHHKSVHTSVFTSFSFHPAESVLQALILPLIVIVLPLHLYAALFILILMTLSAVINHAGVEIYPSGKFGNWMSKWIIGASHHDQHHRKFNYNFGLYFTFWDRWMGTESSYDREWSENKEKPL